ncbi:MAG: ATP-binding cassette domain-containing protein, partial [bacterium]|nr:ATP-binding cassette domain-containing protein [bacterium]
LRHQQAAGYQTLRESLYSGLNRLKGRLLGKKSSFRSKEEFWALREASFQVAPGERLGIIGKNGAGKSTLLKLLSRITVPTKGRIMLNGRVASLLEVGTGFHPELTGRENIFLNGAVMGMRRTEIKKKFDEIVAFAEVEKFLDTPVKRFSSGMYVRLAFSVAAHLEPEILLVDEVLAVGDAEFQKKCLGKMGDIAKAGRTVLFVSHNMGAVSQLCTRAILLKNGRIDTDSGDVETVIGQYLWGDKEERKAVTWENAGNLYQNPYFDLRHFSIEDKNGSPVKLPVRNDSGMFISVKGILKENHPALSVGYAVYTEDNLRVYATLITDSEKFNAKDLETGPIIFKSRIPKRFLNEGNYRVSLIAGIRTEYWFVHPNQDSPNVFLDIKGGLSDSIYWTVKR